MATLRVSPDDYGAIRKHAKDCTEGEFARWLLEKWPSIQDHLGFESTEIWTDWGNGYEPTGEAISPHGYILSIRLSQ